MRVALVVTLIGVGGFGSAVALSQTRLVQDDPTSTSAGGAGDPSTSSGDSSTTGSTASSSTGSDKTTTGTTDSGTTDTGTTDTGTTDTGTTETGTTDTGTTETGTTESPTIASAAAVGAADDVDLSIVKFTDESFVDVNSKLTYTIQVHNAGPATAESVVVTDTLPSGVTYSGSSLGEACSFTPTVPGNASGGGTITCNLGSLEADSDSSFTIDVVPTEPNSNLENDASVAATGQVDTNAENNSTSAFVTVGTLVDVSLTKTGPASVAAGATFVYTLHVANTGSKAVTGVVIQDELPDGLAYNSTSSDATCSADGSFVSCGPYDLAIEGTLDVKIGVTATGTGSVTNNASVSVGEGQTDTNPDNNFASATTNIAAAAPTGSGVLILDTTVSGGASSVEANAAKALGFSVDVVNSDQWAAMTRADFARYRAIILGDRTCGSFYTAAEANTGTWGPAITGNVIINGTDPVFHGKTLVTNAGISFATSVAGKTGAYISLSCRYNGVAGGTPVGVLNALGSFTVTGVPCSAAIHIVATHPALGSLTDDYLSNWGCSVHEAFQSWPSDFKVLAIAKDIGSSFTAPDGTLGTPYILARGEGLAVISDIKLAPADATNNVGEPHTLTATVTQTGAPVVGADVTFKVVSGPNDGLTGHALTGTNGTATFTYTSKTPGTDHIQASFLDSTGKTQTSDTVTKTWLAATTASIALAPASASNPVGTSHTVTATVTQGGSPVVEKTVTFKVDSGPDAGTTGTAVTNSDGNASFTYTNNGTAGTDSISASILDGDVTRTATASKTWVAAAPLAIALAPASATNTVGTSHTVTATVTQGGAPVSGKTVDFSIDSGPDVDHGGSAVTDSAGHASFTYTNNGSTGTDTITASVQDGDFTRTATASKTWVAAAPLALSLTPASATNTVGTSHTVTATVTQGGAAVSGKTVTFSIDSGPDAGKSSSAVTNNAGQATFTYTNNGTVGTDDIAASIQDGETTRSAHASKTWVAAPPLVITLAPAEATNPVGSSHTVTATVTQGGEPVSGKTVTFSIDTGPDADHGGSAVTDSAGHASFTYTNNGSTGIDSISASVQDGDATRTATASKTWNPISSPDLQITVDVTPSSPTVGSAVTFAYHLRNKGSASANSVNFKLTPPTNATLVSVNAITVSPPVARALAATFSPGCAAIGSDVQCVIGTVLPGGGSDVTMIVTPTSTGPLISSASAGATETTTSPQVTTVTVGPAAGGGGGGGGGGSSSGGGGGGGGSTTTTTSTETGTGSGGTGGTGTVASAPGEVPPAPPPPTNPGELNAIGQGATVNGKPITDGEIVVLKTGDIVDVSNGGAITVTNFKGGTATFSSFQPPIAVRNGPSTGGTTQATVVSAFRVDQSTAPDVPTIATLVGGSFASCGSVSARKAASANAPKTVVRELWGTAKGQFRTRARYSSATVRGTQWLTQDRCDGSLVTVTKDVVDVFDFSLKKTITLNVGQSYLALPPRKISAVKPKKAPAKKAAKPKTKAKANVKATAKTVKK